MNGSGRAADRPQTLVLASGSPRRHELLGRLGIDFEVVVSGFDESTVVHHDPAVLVAELARCKADEAADRVGDRPVVAADTVVVLDGRILGKPADDADARATLSAMSGRDVEVLTGVEVRSGDEAASVVSVSGVRILGLDDERLSAYLATGVHRDKAGSLAVQHDRPTLVASTSGCPTNLLGLPLCELARIFDRLDIGYTEDVPTCCR